MKGNGIIKNRSKILMVILPVVACFAFLPGAQAACLDGCNNSLFNVFQGDDALISNTTGSGNSAFGWRALFSNTDGSFNTAVGGGALVLNNADSNTAVGAAALLLNTTGTENTAIGTDALVHNNGSFNNAIGAFALFSNIDGNLNNALGEKALTSNLHATGNTAVGNLALSSNDSTGNGFANDNTAVGLFALANNIDGDGNTAVGAFALFNENGIGGNGASNNAIGVYALTHLETGSFNQAIGGGALLNLTDGAGNVAIGDDALFFSDGSYNTAVGYAVGENLTLATSSENIYIGDSAGTVDFLGNPGGDEFGVIRIGSFSSGTNACFINGIANNGPFADTVTIDPATGQLGGLPSSARFKKDIEPMDKTSEAIYSLKPVTFHYKKDKTNTPWFGLIAEDVAKVNPALIGVDKEGKPYCVAYDKVNAMLLNEFLKEHRKVELQDRNAQEQQKEIDALKAELKEQKALIQRVTAQLELSKSAPQTVLNNR